MHKCQQQPSEKVDKTHWKLKIKLLMRIIWWKGIRLLVLHIWCVQVAIDLFVEWSSVRENIFKVMRIHQNDARSMKLNNYTIVKQSSRIASVRLDLNIWVAVGSMNQVSCPHGVQRSSFKINNHFYSFAQWTIVWNSNGIVKDMQSYYLALIWQWCSS